ncbi:hypothetical protein SAMN02787079_03901 [Lysinibacillus sp. TC-37]|nr:hypothetical protein SAMN02787078_03948 [Lysinibacillus sp. SG9]SDB50314.1 hypothetical protein SAMN02787079_03901 [Lysinibacillus sp. TC-37]SFT10126.1 hypothetical protein SAMN02787087_03561 [Lysinibacillus sp. SG55]
MEKNDTIKQPTVDIVENTLIYTGRTSMIDRLLVEKCEWCSIVGVPLEMHHIHKLKGLKGKKMWEQKMIARRRKTMALCTSCHHDLHNIMVS